MIGMRTEMQILPLRERYADNGQVAFMAYIRADVQLEHPAAFVDVVGVLP